MPVSCATSGLRKRRYLYPNSSLLLAEGDSRGFELPGALNLSPMWAQHVPVAEKAARRHGSRKESEMQRGRRLPVRHQKHRVQHIQSVMQKPPEHLTGRPATLEEFGSSRNLFQPLAEELSQDQREFLKTQELLPYLAFVDSIQDASITRVKKFLCKVLPKLLQAFSIMQLQHLLYQKQHVFSF